MRHAVAISLYNDECGFCKPLRLNPHVLVITLNVYGPENSTKQTHYLFHFGLHCCLIYTICTINTIKFIKLLRTNVHLFDIKTHHTKVNKVKDVSFSFLVWST